MNTGINKIEIQCIRRKDGGTTIAGILIHFLRKILLCFLMLVSGVGQKIVTSITGTTVTSGAVDNVIHVRIIKKKSKIQIRTSENPWGGGLSFSKKVSIISYS